MAGQDFTSAVEELDRQSGVDASRWRAEGRRVSAWGVTRMMLSEFRRVYFKENARSQGVEGLFRAVNAAMLRFLTYAKCWELDRAGQ